MAFCLNVHVLALLPHIPYYRARECKHVESVIRSQIVSRARAGRATQERRIRDPCPIIVVRNECGDNEVGHKKGAEFKGFFSSFPNLQ